MNEKEDYCGICTIMGTMHVAADKSRAVLVNTAVDETAWRRISVCTRHYQELVAHAGARVRTLAEPVAVQPKPVLHCQHKDCKGKSVIATWRLKTTIVLGETMIVHACDAHRPTLAQILRDMPTVDGVEEVKADA